MKRCVSLLGFVLSSLILIPALNAEPLTLKAKKRDDRVQVFAGDELFTEYRYREEQKYPYFYPVNGPATGESVTTETSQPYPHHHSLFFGCDRVNGGNYWQQDNNHGQIVPKKVELKQTEGDEIIIANTCEWQHPEKDSPFKDKRVITISAPAEDIRIIDFKVTVTALIDVTILNNNHSLFSARMVPELSVNEGGTLINAHGNTSEKGTFNKKSPWCDYYGTRDGKTEGLAIFDHPDNPWYPSKWFTRDYGFFSPTEMNWLEGGELHIFQGEKHTLQYRVIVHEGNHEAAKIAQRFEDWTK